MTKNVCAADQRPHRDKRNIRETFGEFLNVLAQMTLYIHDLLLA